MRTTVNLDVDVAAAVQRLRHEGVGVSEAVNELARRGIAERNRPNRMPFVQPTVPAGIRRNVDNVAEVLESLDED